MRCYKSTYDEETEGENDPDAGARPLQITVPATHFAFATRYDRWPEPFALHKCDRPSCVDPDHLFEGTQKDNVADMDRKGRRGAVDPATRVRGEKHHAFWITNAAIVDIKERRLRGERVNDIAKRYKTHPSTVSAILHGRYQGVGTS